MPNKNNPFSSSGLRLFFWPIHDYELKKFIPLALMSFLFTFIYSILRNTKDALLITTPGGIEAVPFLTIFSILPVLIFALIYTKISNLISKEKLFVLSLLPFLIFFPLFGFVLYPNKDLLHSTTVVDILIQWLPSSFSGLAIMTGNWIFSLFYLTEEIWASFAIGVLFWGFANTITKISEAKRFYALFALSANLGTLLSGPVIKFLLNFVELSPSTHSFSSPINYLMQLCFISSILILVIYCWINRIVLTDSRFFNPEEQLEIKTEKPKLSLEESLKFLMRSRPILCIAALVVSYQIVINTAEVILKNQLGMAFPDPKSYLEFMSNYSIVLGCVSTFTMLFISHNIIRLWGWTIASYITPWALLICATFFFLLIIFENSIASLVSNLGISSLTLSIVVGTTLSIVGKTSKYSLFDPTKEMAYIPLDEESKVKGKAIVDSLGSRSGKALGSGILIIFIHIFGSIVQAIPALAFIITGIIILWVYAIKALAPYISKISTSFSKTKITKAP